MLKRSLDPTAQLRPTERSGPISPYLPVVDERKAERLPLHLPVAYTLLLPNEFLRGTIETTDISGSGLQFAVPRMVSPQTVCQIDLRLPDAAEPLSFLGRVAWCRQSQGKQKDLYDIGISLSAFDAYHEGAFARYCQFIATQFLVKYLR